MRLVFFIFFLFSYQAMGKTIPKILKMCWHPGPPYASPKLKENGFDADLVKHVANKAGFKIKIEWLPWARCVQDVKSGRLDMLLSMWENVDKHQRDFEFFYNTSFQYVALMTLNKSPLWSGELKHLNNIRFGLHNNGGYNKELTDHKGFKFVYLNSDIQKLKMLRAGRIDLLISDPNRVRWHIENSLKDPKLKVKVLWPLRRTDFGSPSISKKHPFKDEIKLRYNKAYKELCKEKFFVKLREKHGVSFRQRDCLY